MALSKENADFIVDRSCVSEVIETYDLMIKELTLRFERVEGSLILMSTKEWSGDGRISFDRKMGEWIKEMRQILDQLNQTKKCLVYLLEEADDLRKKAEQIKSAVV